MTRWIAGTLVVLDLFVAATPANVVQCERVVYRRPIATEYEMEAPFAAVIAGSHEVERRRALCGDISMQPATAKIVAPPER